MPSDGEQIEPDANGPDSLFGSSSAGDGSQQGSAAVGAGQVGGGADGQAGASARGFALSGDERRELSRAQLGEWEKIYHTGGRQLRRWWKEGAPLDDPAAMPIWWEKERAAGRKSWGVPTKIREAAKAAKVVTTESAAGGGAYRNQGMPAGGDALAQGFAGARGNDGQAGMGGTPRVIPLLTLADLEFDDSEVVRNAARRVRALDIRVEAAYAGKSGEDVDYLQGLLTKAAEALRKLQDSEQKRKVVLGAFVNKAAVERDLATLVELLRQMDETEVRRVTELCPSMSVEVKAQVAAAIMRVGSARRRIFRSLGALKSVQGALAELAAA